MSRERTRHRRIALLVLFVGLGPAGVVHAEVSDECGPWTWLPDFRCEQRTARPENSFNPVGMPFLFEDPHITTGLNFAYVYHRLPEGPAFDGGAMHVLALQIRLALTDRLAFIATKDGFPAMLYPGDDAVVEENVGVLDMTLGFKYALIDSREHNFILSPALRYEIPLGSEKVFQGFGSGVVIPSASFRWGLEKLGLPGANIVGSLGGQIPADGDKNVESLFYNIHLDYGFEVNNSIVKFIVPFLELNGLYYTSSGKGTNPVYTTLGPPLSKIPLSAAQAALGTGPFEGVDVANLGSQGMNGESVVVMGGGLRIPTTWGISFAAMYEGPVSGRKDIHDGRFTFMATWEL